MSIEFHVIPLIIVSKKNTHVQHVEFARPTKKMDKW